MAAVFQLKLKASGLPNYRVIHTPNCYASITIDNDHIMMTSAVSGSNPQWNECFDVSLEESSTIKIQLYHVMSPSKEVLRGTALINVRDFLPRDHVTISHQHKIHQSGVNFHRNSFVVTSLCRKIMQQPPLPTDLVAPNISSSMPSAAVEEVSHPAEVMKRPTEEILDQVDRAETAVTKLKPDGRTVTDNNNAPKSSELYNNILGYVEKVIQLGDVLTQVHPYAEMAWKVLTAAHTVLKAQVTRDDKIRTLLISIHDMLEFIGKDDAFSKISKLQATVSSMMDEIYRCALFIQEYGDKSRTMRIIIDNLSTTTDDRIDQFISSFNRLKDKFDRGINVQTYNTVKQVASVLQDLQISDTDKLLEDLPGWNLDGVKFDESKICLEGTRRKLLDDIRAWVDSPAEHRVLWLSGGAGTGKTSISNSVAVLFDNIGRLGACFCFNRDIAALNTPNYLFGNLCYQLAHFDSGGQFGIRPMILSAIRSMGHVASSSLRTQARKLIVAPTNAAKLVEPVLVVIDALDESGTTLARKGLLEAIAAEFPRLPHSIKIIITSRDEHDIRVSIQDCSKELCIDNAENTQEDISSYIQHRLKAIQLRSHPRQDWPGPQKLQVLSNRAGNLFIWASVACNFIEEKRNPAWRLDLLLNVTNNLQGTTGSPLKKLDVLYNSILMNAFPDEYDTLVDFRLIVGAIVVLENPLTQAGLDSLLGIGDELEGDLSVLQDRHEAPLSSSDEILSLLRPIFMADSTQSTPSERPLRLLHPSLYEFLTSRADEHFRIDPLEQHRSLAIRCLAVMNGQLKFDICKIGTPCFLNKEIKDLHGRISDYIPEELRYSCRSFAYHLTKISEPSTSLKDALDKFVSEHILHWIEVMSLLEDVNKAEGCLFALVNWVKDGANGGTNLQVLLEDAVSLLRNSGYVIRLSALHTYFSALALTPRNTTLYQNFIHTVAGVPSVDSSHPTWPTASVRVMEGHTRFVNDVVFSPDGKKLVSASDDETVRFWDVESGQEIEELLEHHTFQVGHVAFSPDGKRLASAGDRMVQVWDFEVGQASRKSLGGHFGGISNVAFSPDGKKLASGSSDLTVRLWDVEGGRQIGEALEGHTHSVRHVAFSPDGTKVVSASDDKTVRLWNAESIRAVGSALRGHTDDVHYVVFSPDGDKVASASSDGTVRLWDAKTGQAIRNALEGHTNWVRHIAFSPNGRKLASASNDKTLRIWDLESGETMGESLKGHTDAVIHVVFSPDGTKIASASHDKSIRLWNVEDCKAIGGPLEGHTDWVRRVSFSPDGKKLVSASDDKTVRLWDFESGQMIRADPEGHTDQVYRVVLSPDGKKLASASNDNTVRLWDAQSGRAIGKIHEAQPRKFVFTPDGKQLVTTSFATLRIWDVESGRAVGEPIEGHASWIRYLAFSPDERKLVSASYGTLQIWDLENGRAIGGTLEGHTNWVNHVALSPDGTKLASSSSDKTVRLWDAERGLQIGDALAGHTDRVYYAAFSPDGTKLGSASRDKTVRLWDVESGQAVGGALRGHTGTVRCVVFSPEGTELASAAEDGTVRLWDVASGKCIRVSSDPNADIITSHPWVAEGLRSAGTEHTSPDELTDSILKILHASTSVLTGLSHTAVSIDPQGFVRCGTRRLLWLPPMLRGPIVAHSSVIAVGGGSGAVTFIKMEDH